MHAAKIKERHIERDGGFQMLKAFAESQTQPRKAAKMRSHAEVCAFDVRSADAFQLRASSDGYWDSRGNFRGVVPLRAVAPSRAIKFQQLREVNICAEVFFDCGEVAFVAIGCQLESSGDALAQVFDKFVSAGDSALPDQVGQNHFRFAVNRHPDVGIAPLARIAGIQVRFFRVNESPEFIGLHKVRTGSAHLAVKQRAALFPHSQEKRENRPLMRLSDAGDRADTHSFQQERDDLSGFFVRDVMASERLSARLGECGFTTWATETLDSVASVAAELFCFVVAALEAGHVGSPFDFSQEKPDNQILWSECGLRPYLDFAPLLAQTRGGAFYIYSLRPDIYFLTARSLAARLFDFPVGEESPDYGMDARKQIPVRRNIETELAEFFTDIIRSHRRVTRFEGCSDRVSQTYFVHRVELLAEQPGHRDRTFTDGSNTLFEEFLIFNALTQFGLSRNQVGLEASKSLFVFAVVRHSENYIVCLYLCQG